MSCYAYVCGTTYVVLISSLRPCEQGAAIQPFKAEAVTEMQYCVINY